MELVLIPSRSELLGSNVDQNINIFNQLKDNCFTTTNLQNHFDIDCFVSPTNNHQDQDLRNVQSNLREDKELEMPSIIPSYGNETTWTAKDLDHPDSHSGSVVFEQALEPTPSEVAFRDYPILIREPVFQASDYTSMIMEPDLNIISSEMNLEDDAMFPQNFLDIQLLTFDKVQAQQNRAENTPQASTDEDEIILDHEQRNDNYIQLDGGKSLKAQRSGTKSKTFVSKEPIRHKKMKPSPEIPSNTCNKKTLHKDILEVEVVTVTHVQGPQNLDENASQSTIVDNTINFDNQDKREKIGLLKDTILQKETGAIQKSKKCSKPYSGKTINTTKFLDKFCPCLHCKKVFQSFEDLRKHHLSHEKVQVNVLNYKKASRYLLSRRKLQIRLKKLELNQNFFTRVKSSLGRKLNNRKIDFKGQKLRTSNVAQSCLHCKRTFGDLEHLRKHHLHHEKVKIINKCYQCNRTFSGFNVLMNHIKMLALQRVDGAKTSNYINCKHCKETFSTKSGMIQHLKSHVFPHKCSQCGKTFPQRYGLSRHILTHAKEANISHYRCTHCDEIFNSKLELEEHFSSLSFPNNSHLREISFQQNIDLNRPLSTHSNSGQSYEKLHSDSNILNQNLKIHTAKSLHLCLQCGVAFTDKSVLDLHTLSHLGQNPHTCNDCGKACTNESKLRRHVLSHSKRKYHKCAHCGKVFVQKHDLNLHILSHLNETQSIVLQNNGEQFKEYLRDKSNSSNVIMPKLLHECLVCRKIFNSFEDLKEHRHDVIQNSSPLCNTIQMNDLKNRMQVQDLGLNINNQDAEPDDDLVVLYDTHLYKCNGCTEEFPSNTRLVEHQKQHYSVMLHKCFQCKESFFCQSQLKLHLIGNHSKNQHLSGNPTLRDYLQADTRRKNILTFICNQCGKSFAEKWHLNRHMWTHLKSQSMDEQLPETPSLEATTYRCSPCGKLFSQKWQLSRHMRTHSSEKLYKCSRCEWSFRSASDLNRHLLSHLGGKTYRCNFCRKLFRNENNFNEHVSLRKCNQCSLCGLTCSGEDELNRHVASHSVDSVEQHKCSVCERVFSFKKYLTKHMKIHTVRDKCHQCKQCGNRFFTGGDLRRHMLIHLRAKILDLCL